MAEYPEHEKLQKVKDESQAIGYFLEWFFTEFDVYPKGVVPDYMETAEGFVDFARALGGGEITIEYPMRVSGGDAGINKILAHRYGIDYDELAAEKDRMLAEIREAANG